MSKRKSSALPRATPGQIEQLDQLAAQTGTALKSGGEIDEEYVLGITQQRFGSAELAGAAYEFLPAEVNGE